MDHSLDLKLPPFYASVVIHGLLLGLMIFLITREPDTGAKSEPIQIESINGVKPKRNVPRHTVQPLANRVSDAMGTNNHQVSLKDLGLRINHDVKPDEAAPDQAQEVPDEDSWDVMNPDPKVAQFNQYIYRTVQGWLDRDSSVDMDPIYGTVKVRIWFDENGNWLENETVYQAVDPNFQRIVARALRKSFAAPVPKPYLYLHHKFFIERMVRIRQY